MMMEVGIIILNGQEVVWLQLLIIVKVTLIFQQMVLQKDFISMDLIQVQLKHLLYVI